MLLIALAASLLGAEPAPVVRDPPPTVIDPASAPEEQPLFVSDAELERIAAADINAARVLLRRTARSSPSATSRATALRLLATHDPGTATSRICARQLRIDIESAVRRSAAECLGRSGPEIASGQTAALVAALDDSNLDVVTMAGWALANVGEAGAITPLAERIKHPDERVARLFIGYAERMRARLGLEYRASTSLPEPARDDAGRRLVPPGYALVSNAHGLDLAASTGWLGLYGGLMGWYHGAYLLSAHGGPGGAQAAALGGLGGAALGAAAGSAYAFTRADTLPLAHTVVQMGTLGTFAGFGAGQLSGVPPSSAVAGANLSFVGTLAGTALGVALVESRPPTLGALGAGMSAGLLTGTATGAVTRSYGFSDGAAIGAALFLGSVAGASVTISSADYDIGLFPIAGATLFGLGGAGMGALILTSSEQAFGGVTEASGWGVAAGTAAGAATGAIVGLIIPRDLDPLLSRELDLFPPSVAAIPDGQGGAAPGFVVAGRF